MDSIDRGTEKGSRLFYFVYPSLMTDMFYYISNIGYFICNEEYRIHRKEYPDPLFVYMTGGELVVDECQTVSVAHKGECALLRCDSEHIYYADKKAEFLFFHFNGINSLELCNNLIGHNGGNIFDSPWKSVDEIPAYKILTGMDDGYQPKNSEISTAAYNTICTLSTERGTGADQSGIDRVVKYINDHVSENITIELLASIAYLSPYYFSRLFKKETGFSPMEYVLNIRIKKAKILLRTTNYTVQDIALRVGYSTAVGFINAFTRSTGISPNKFRNYPM